MKKMRYLMSDLGYSCADNVSSFGLESLLWNIPNSCFTKYCCYGFVFEEIVKYFENKGYNVFFTGAKFVYKNTNITTNPSTISKNILVYSFNK